MKKVDSLREQERKNLQQEKKQQKKRDRERLKAEKKHQKEMEKKGFATKSRKNENDKVRETGKKLNIAILVVAILLIIMIAIVFLV